MSDDLLQFLEIEQPVLDQFIKQVANKGLQQYQRVIQWGEHHGQSLYNHIVSGVFLIHSLQELLQLEEVELKVITLAYCIHDLNKTYEGREKSYGRIATPENAIKELEKISADGFFADWRGYVEDITELIRGHSGHNSVRGNSLDRRSDPTRLGKSRLIELDELIRAVDVSDLSHTYSERKHKQTFLSHFNSLSHQQYRLIAHQVSEQRGLLTNIVHNQTAKFLYKRCNAVPVLFYPQGTYYLMPIEEKIILSEQDCLSVGGIVEQTIKEMKKQGFAKFIDHKSPQGIKIKKELLNLNVPYSEIFAYIDTCIQRKKYKLDEKEQEGREKLYKALSSSKEHIKDNAQEWLEKKRIMPENQELMRLGELLRTFYIFLSDHCKKEFSGKLKKWEDPWIYLYQLLGIQQHDRYLALDVRYSRSYVVAKDLSIEYSNLLSLIIEQAHSILPLGNANKEAQSFRSNDVITYVKNNLSFSIQEFAEYDFSKHLIQYCQNQHTQSCHSSSPFKTIQWESGYVPEGIKVNQFSNRLKGGDLHEPKRYIDPIVQLQFSIEKLNYTSAKDKTLYLHLMPYSFMTAPFIESFQRMFQKLRSIDVSAISLSFKELIKFFDSNESTYTMLPIKHENTMGMLVPEYSEVIGNIISMPLNPMGKNKTEKYLNAMEYALVLHKHFGVKILLTELAIPILNLTEHIKTDIFLDGVPSALRGLVTSDDLYFHRANETAFGSGDIVWERLRSIREMYDLLWTDSKENELVAMAQAFAASENSIFFVVDRLIEKRANFECKRSKKKIDKEVIARRLAKQLKPCMEKIISVGSHV